MKDKNCSYYIAVIKDGEWIHCEVEEDVYVYIKQLEAYIKHPGESRLLDVYTELRPDCKHGDGNEVEVL